MRQMARWGVLPFLAAPVGAWALGLGDIQLQSALNQPLRAQIRLSATPEEIQDLDISVADQATFQRYGLDRPGFLSTLQFRVGKNDAGNDVIFVSSSQAIAEPFVTMLIQASWPKGRSLREYTVLLDPPTFAPESAEPVRQAQSRPAESATPGGAITRPPAAAPAAPAARAPTRTVAPRPAAARPAAASLGGTYGPVQRGQTLWGIASQLQPAGVTINQMMVAIYQANPRAFQGNMNLLNRGATLQVPSRDAIGTVAASNATAEVQRQTDSWRGGGSGAEQARLVLVPPSDDAGAGASAGAGGSAAASTAAAGAASSAQADQLRGQVDELQSELDESRRLLEVRDQQLSELQQRLNEATAGGAGSAAPEQAASEAAAGAELEPDQVFAEEPESANAEAGAVPDDTAPESTPAPETQPAQQATPPAAPPSPPPSQVVVTTPAAPSLLSRVTSLLLTPLVLIGIGAGALLLTALWYLRRRREEYDDVTGRWEALEAEVDADENTSRLRRQAEEKDFIVEESRPSAPPLEVPPFEPEPEQAEEAPAADSSATGSFQLPSATEELADETLSSQTVINLDQADPVAEADFHMAYGLYDQAAELVSQALANDPDNRSLKLKLLEVFFVWGNKEAFLDAAKRLRAEMGDVADPDWDKVVIMGKQICPDEALFAEATAAAGEVDLDLDAGDSPALDFAFDEGANEDVDLDLGVTGEQAPDLQLEATGNREAKAAAAPAAEELGTQSDAMLDIGAETSAGLEEALFNFDQDEDDTGRRTTPDIDFDSLAETQESPTVETAKRELEDESSAITMESPTVESSAVFGADAEAPTVETPTVETAYKSAEPTAEQPAIGENPTELTAELDLNDLGLEVKDLENLPDLGEVPSAEGGETDTREQLALESEAEADDELLSATGVTQVLNEGEDLEHVDTSVLGDDDATMMAPGIDDDTMTGTEVLEDPQLHAVAGSGERTADGLDLNLDDLNAALGDGDTVEQPKARSFAKEVFGGGGGTPVDLDVGANVAGSDDPTGTEENPLDAQTMTEVGTKLDLARAYIDMGDPDGARSILEEVLDEGDAGQKREAQSLIQVLSA